MCLVHTRTDEWEPLRSAAFVSRLYPCVRAANGQLCYSSTRCLGAWIGLTSLVVERSCGACVTAAIAVADAPVLAVPVAHIASSVEAQARVSTYPDGASPNGTSLFDICQIHG